jgi:hypothetical protein
MQTGKNAHPHLHMELAEINILGNCRVTIVGFATNCALMLIVLGATSSRGTIFMQHSLGTNARLNHARSILLSCFELQSDQASTV